jgi:arginyl-tRNA synthetase
MTVKGEENEDKVKARLSLYLSARNVLGSALRLLSITTLERT